MRLKVFLERFILSQNIQLSHFQLLQTFLMIPSIYNTQTFRDKFERQARANIEREIEELKK